MKALRALLAVILLVASASSVSANGGVIILLNSKYRFMIGSAPYHQTLVVVASDSEIRDIEYRLDSESDVVAVQVKDSDVYLQHLTPESCESLSGQVVDSSTPVLVVSESYAEQTWGLGG